MGAVGAPEGPTRRGRPYRHDGCPPQQMNSMGRSLPNMVGAHHIWEEAGMDPRVLASARRTQSR
jgi:hypothetical protein